MAKFRCQEEGRGLQSRKTEKGKDLLPCAPAPACVPAPCPAPSAAPCPCACTEPAPRSPLLCAVDLACGTEHATLHQPASLHRPCTSPALSSLRPCASKPLCPARLQQPRALHRPCVTSPVGCNPLHQPGPKQIKKVGKREHHLWKKSNSSGSGKKGLSLVQIVSDLPNEKEAVYKALDKRVAWETEFPLAAAAKALQILRKRSQWLRVIQVCQFSSSC
ncbi:hypothetical protein SLEP1_g6172 [Rubroshorea leprosula]|uniref:Uncharacterized protein n=1 Tax=Rubroshorea leprosula TaxID=152421 RepID=A0AAV5I3F6_9ROSI|nr:hypothetical protein SLEP1_g6172 [Rubroshorea leprosula]